MEHEIIIVDRGRGPQLSTSRITVQDVLPYFQLGYTHERIIREIMPSLSIAEIEAVERYVEENRQEVLEEDRRICEWNATRKNLPEIQEVLRQGREERLAWLAAHQKEQSESPNGDGRSS